MLVELLNGIVDLARRSNSVQRVELPGNQMLVVKPDGTTEQLDGNRATHSDAILSFGSLMEWIGSVSVDSPIFVAVNDSAIRAVANRDEPHASDSSGLPLEHSAAYQDLAAWMLQPRTVTRVVRALRTSLHGTCTEEYRSIFKRVDFTRRNDGSKTVAHTGESMGRSIEVAAQSAAGEIPEVMSFDVRLFSNVPVESYDLDFAVYVDAEAEKIHIAAIGDMLADAHRLTRETLVARIKQEYPDAVVVEAV